MLISHRLPGSEKAAFGSEKDMNRLTGGQGEKQSGPVGWPCGE